jgi:hypothetical protein
MKSRLHACFSSLSTEEYEREKFGLIFIALK